MAFIPAAAQTMQTLNKQLINLSRQDCTVNDGKAAAINVAQVLAILVLSV